MMVWRGIGLIFINYKRKKWWLCSTKTWTTLSCAMTKDNIGSDVRSTPCASWYNKPQRAQLCFCKECLPESGLEEAIGGPKPWVTVTGLPSKLAMAARGSHVLGMWPVLTEMRYIYTGFQKLLWKKNINRQFLYWSHFLNDNILKTMG